MGAIYEVVKNVAVYLILVTVLLNLVNGSSYKKYVELVCGMVLILIILMPVTSLLSLEDDFLYNYNLSSFKVKMMDEGVLKEAEEVQQQKMKEEYEKILKERITTVVEKQGRYVNQMGILLSDEDYGVIEDITVEISDVKKYEDKSSVEKVKIEPISISEDSDIKKQEGTIEKNKVTEAIRKELASELAIKEERIVIYQIGE